MTHSTRQFHIMKIRQHRQFIKLAMKDRLSLPIEVRLRWFKECRSLRRTGNFRLSWTLGPTTQYRDSRMFCIYTQDLIWRLDQVRSTKGKVAA